MSAKATVTRKPRTVFCETCRLRLNSTRCGNIEKCNFCSNRVCHGSVKCLREYVHTTNAGLELILKEAEVAEALAKLNKQPLDWEALDVLFGDEPIFGYTYDASIRLDYVDVLNEPF